MTAQGVDVPGVLLVDLARGEGGAERRVLQLAAMLPAVGVPVHVACVAGTPLHRSLTRAEVPHTPAGRSRFDPRIAVRLRRLAREHPDWVLDAHNAQSQLWAHVSTWRVRRALVATVHSEYRLSESPRLGLSPHELALRLAIRSGWSFIAVSTSVEDYVRGLGAAAERVRTVWSSVSCTDLPSRESCGDVRAALGIDPTAFVVLTAGRLVGLKNVDLIVRAVGRVRRQVPSVQLVVAGGGPERRSLERLVKQLGLMRHVTFLGHRTDVPSLMAASDVCAMASTTEGLPYTLIEAASVGTPIVATDVGAIGWIFTHRQSAVLLDVPDEITLADAIADVAGAPSRAATRARRARDVVRRRLSPLTMVEDTLTAYADAHRTPTTPFSPQAVGSAPTRQQPDQEAI